MVSFQPQSVGEDSETAAPFRGLSRWKVVCARPGHRRNPWAGGKGVAACCSESLRLQLARRLLADTLGDWHLCGARLSFALKLGRVLHQLHQLLEALTWNVEGCIYLQKNSTLICILWRGVQSILSWMQDLCLRQTPQIISYKSVAWHVPYRVRCWSSFRSLSPVSLPS